MLWPPAGCLGQPQACLCTLGTTVTQQFACSHPAEDSPIQCCAHGLLWQRQTGLQQHGKLALLTGSTLARLKDEVRRELNTLQQGNSLSKEAYQHCSETLDHEWGPPKNPAGTAGGARAALMLW